MMTNTTDRPAIFGTNFMGFASVKVWSPAKGKYELDYVESTDLDTFRTLAEEALRHNPNLSAVALVHEVEGELTRLEREKAASDRRERREYDERKYREMVNRQEEEEFFETYGYWPQEAVTLA